MLITHGGAGAFYVIDSTTYEKPATTTDLAARWLIFAISVVVAGFFVVWPVQ